MWAVTACKLNSKFIAITYYYYLCSSVMLCKKSNTKKKSSYVYAGLGTALKKNLELQNFE